jgi:DNA polymerase-3 subunit delta'
MKWKKTSGKPFEMSYPAELLKALDALKAGLEKGRLGHAYVVHGSPRGLGGQFVTEFLSVLLEDPERVAQKRHPDVHYLEPESKSRVLDVQQLRKLGATLSQTSFSNGWKVAVILYADRMNVNAANAFLKTLEEPSPRTLIFLVSEQPGALLATITSRCQSVLLPREGVVASAWWQDDLLELLRSGWSQHPAEAIGKAGYFAGLLKEIAARAQEEFESMEENQGMEKKVMEARVSSRLLEESRKIMDQVLAWRRDILVLCHGETEIPLNFENERQTLLGLATQVTPQQAEESTERVGKMLQLLERKFRPQVIFEMDSLATLA